MDRPEALLFGDLKRYYLATAPDEPLPAQSKPPLAQTLDRFAVIEPKDPLPNAFTTLVRIRPEAGQLLIGDSGRNTLSLYDADGKRIAYPRKFRPPITPVDIAFDGETAFIASIGDVSGADMTARPGFITQLDLASDPLLDGDDFVFAKELPRLADLEFADLDGDGINDLIASGFGTAVGEIAFFRNPTSAAIADPQTLLDLPGAVKTQAFDFNSDGRLDVAALLGNAREGFHILENQGELGFRNRVVFQTHPGMGHTYFELQDFDNDGRIDLLVVNGDNVDSDPYNTYKNYHGIRIYLNQGDFRFDESYFYPMRGAFVARAADFDQDGDLDIAAISFYPDFESPNPEAFVYLENAGRDDLDFRAYTTPKLGEGRWMTMDAGDIDGDGDIDLALGGAYVPIGMSRFPEAFERLSASGPAFLILRNQTAP